MDRLHELNRELYSAHTGVGFGVIASSKQAVAPTVGGWVELGRTTLGSNSSTIDVTGLADKRYYMILSDFEVTTTANNEILRLNADGANNYAMRHNADGTSEQSFINQPGMRNQANTNPVGGQPVFWFGYIANLSAKEKLFQAWAIKQGTAGAGNTTPRAESVGKWANATDAIDQMTLLGEASGNTHITGSEMVVLGWDPADVHTDNFWEELVSVDLSGGAADVIDSGTFTAKKYLWVQLFVQTITGVVSQRLTFNSDTGMNYSVRVSNDGAADLTAVNQSNIDRLNDDMVVNSGGFTNMFIVNNSAEEKLAIAHAISAEAVGAANAPKRNEVVFKWANTAAQITKMTFTNNKAGSMGTNTILKVWGSD